MSGTVLWYLHDHGAGHLSRARAVIPSVVAPVVVAAGPGIAAVARQVLDVPIVELASDIPDRPCPTTGPWHHAPADAAQRRRALDRAAAVERHGCTSAVVDVSMEVTVLARLLGLRVVTVRQSGHRDDAAHRTGLASADAVWVPQHTELEPVDQSVDDRWRFTGAFSRFDPCPPSMRRAHGTRCAVLLVGSGGTRFDASAWRDAEAPAGWSVTIAGASERWAGRVRSVGRIDPVLPLLRDADVVITSAGWAAVADGVSAGTRLAVVAEPRPFEEQEVRSQALADAGLVVALDGWPSPHELGAVLERTAGVEPDRWSTYYDRRGAERAAALVDEIHAA